MSELATDDYGVDNSGFDNSYGDDTYAYYDSSNSQDLGYGYPGDKAEYYDSGGSDMYAAYNSDLNTNAPQQSITPSNNDNNFFSQIGGTFFDAIKGAVPIFTNALARKAAEPGGPAYNPTYKGSSNQPNTATNFLGTGLSIGVVAIGGLVLVLLLMRRK